MDLVTANIWDRHIEKSAIDLGNKLKQLRLITANLPKEQKAQAEVLIKEITEWCAEWCGDIPA